MLQNKWLDILCISETKLDDSIVEKDLNCGLNFKLYRKDRSSYSGGLCIWIRSDIPQHKITNLKFDTLGSAQNHKA